MTRTAAVLLAAVAFAIIGSIASLPMASADTSASVGITHLAAQSASDEEEGIDNASIEARENRIGYHEQRKFPYGMVAFLIGFTLFVTPSLVAYREPARRYEA